MSVVLIAWSAWRPSAVRSTRNSIRRKRLRCSRSYINAMAKRVCWCQTDLSSAPQVASTLASLTN